MEPTGNGIGGDLFAIIWVEKDKKLYGLNASGRSPKNLTLDYLFDAKYVKHMTHCVRAYCYDTNPWWHAQVVLKTA